MLFDLFLLNLVLLLFSALLSPQSSRIFLNLKNRYILRYFKVLVSKTFLVSIYHTIVQCNIQCNLVLQTDFEHTQAHTHTQNVSFLYISLFSSAHVVFILSLNSLIHIILSFFSTSVMYVFIFIFIFIILAMHKKGHYVFPLGQRGGGRSAPQLVQRHAQTCPQDKQRCACKI